MNNEPGVNPQQQRAISHIRGPMMVLAGPGSGKTFVITRRIASLITHGIAPEHILVITFTKASALEMQQRFEQLMEEDYYPVTFGTFHAIFFHILKETYSYDHRNIITEKEKREYMQLVLKEILPEEESEAKLEALLSAISRMKNEGKTPAEFSFAELSKEAFVEICKAYDSLCREYEKLDFDDMVLRCLELLKENPEVLSKWQNQYQYILIDEFQDINQMQYEVIHLLARPQNNLFVVGDDDQSIYGFRGSQPEIMLGFEAEYPDCERVELLRNYRSVGNVVRTASDFIANNKKRYKKELVANKEEGARVKLSECEDQKKQALLIIEKIRALTNAPEARYSYADCAIILRTNRGGAYLLPYLNSYGIPYEFKEKPRSLFKSPHMKDILAFLAFLFAGGKRKDFLLFMNKPLRYIPRAILKEQRIDFEQLIRVSDKKYLKEAFYYLRYHCKQASELGLYGAVRYFLQVMGYESYYRQNAKPSELEAFYEDIKILYHYLEEVETYAQLMQYIEDYEAKLMQVSEQKDEDRITMITMHSSKGLEYPVVFLPDLNDGVVPQKKANGPEAIEEERRVFYVAMTRAKDLLYLSFIKPTKENRLIKSRFLKQMKYMDCV